jgi:hypothetical protein
MCLACHPDCKDEVELEAKFERLRAASIPLYAHKVFPAPSTLTFMGHIPPHLTPETPSRVNDGPLEIECGENQTIKVKLNKDTHRFHVPKETENEHEVIVIIEPKD